MQTKSTVEFNIKALLEQQGKTQAWLAAETGLHPKTVGELVSGRYERIGRTTMALLCEALVCQPGDLFIRVPAYEVAHD